jgi:2,6-dihydroxypyridine 3-monooxygenase
MPQSHLLTYPIPVVDPVSGALEIQINWLWYRNVATGSALDELLTDSAGVRRDVSVPASTVQEQHLTELRSSAATLPPILAQLVLGTARPFIQAIWDLEVERMAFGRVCLIGDAAFVARPHAAAGSAKAAADAWALGEALVATGGDVRSALTRWEPAQLSLGRSVISRTRAAGDRAQVAGTWSPGDPLPFGLYREGDSEQ